MERVDLTDDYICFEIGYCGNPISPYAHIQLEKSTKLILSHFQEEDYLLIYDNLDNKNIQLVCLYISYRPKKHVSRMDITNGDQNDYAFAPIYGDGSTDFHRNMISVVVFY